MNANAEKTTNFVARASPCQVLQWIPAREKVCDEKRFEAARMVVSDAFVPFGMGILAFMWELLCFLASSQNPPSEHLKQCASTLHWSSSCSAGG
eukprot:3317745-Rhodomonas_salina.1